MGTFFKSMNETKDFPWIVRGHYDMSKFCFDCHNKIITWIYFIFSFFLVGPVCQNQLRKPGVLWISLFIIEKPGVRISKYQILDKYSTKANVWMPQTWFFYLFLQLFFYFYCSFSLGLLQHRQSILWMGVSNGILFT